MTHLFHNNTKDNYPLIALISQEGIARLNKLFNTHYTKGAVTTITVKRDKKAEDNTKFFDRLMRRNQTL